MYKQRNGVKVEISIDDEKLLKSEWKINRSAQLLKIEQEQADHEKNRSRRNAIIQKLGITVEELKILKKNYED